MTVAVLSLKDTATLATPGTALRLPLTIEGQAAQSILFTARVIVLSAATAADEATIEKAKAACARSFLMGSLRSRVEEHGCNEIEAKGGDDQDCRENEPGPDDPVRQRTRASCAVGASEARGSIDQPITVSEEGYRGSDKPRLIGCKPREVADPSAAHAKPKQRE